MLGLQLRNTGFNRRQAGVCTHHVQLIAHARIAQAFSDGLGVLLVFQIVQGDALTQLRDVMQETIAYGLEKVRAEQIELGAKVRALLESKGFSSVAAQGFQAPGVVVSYTDDVEIHNGKKFIAQGLQTAAGVPLQCDEPADYRSFRIGLFGLDKLHNVDRTVAQLAAALEKVA